MTFVESVNAVGKKAPGKKEILKRTCKHVFWLKTFLHLRLMKSTLFLVLFYSSLTTLCAQQAVVRDSVQIEGNRYYLEGRKLSMQGLQNLVRFDEEAAPIMRKAQLNYQAASFLGAVGIVLPLFPLSDEIRGAEPNWNIAILGGVSVVAAILLNNSRHKRVAESISVYHRNLGTKNTTGATHRHELGVFVRF